MSGLLIVFEGINGSGKSTLIEGIRDHLEREGHKVVVTREPGGTRFGECIRNTILDVRADLCSTAQMMAFAASRAQHVQELILPAIADGKVVLCDRFELSSIAFQHYGSGVRREIVQTLNDIATEGLGDYTTFLLDLPVEVSMQRLMLRGEAPERFELESMAFHKRVQQGYLQEARQGNAFILDAQLSKQELLSNAIDIVNGLLKKQSFQQGIECSF